MNLFERKKRIEISPSEVVLDLTSSESPTSVLKISNVSDYPMAFKVKTTNPSRYLVKPNQELLLPGASVEISIRMQARDCAYLLEHGLMPPVKDDKNDYEDQEEGREKEEKDKFLIATVVVDEEFTNNYKEAKKNSSSKEVQAIFHNLWSNTFKESISSKRINCRFIFPPESKHAMPTGVTTPAKADKVVETGKKPSNESTLQAATATLASPASTVASSSKTQLQQITQQPQFEVNSVSKMDIDKKYEKLSQDYKETLAILVTVTEERDRFQTKYREVTNELMKFKNSVRTENIDQVSPIIKTAGYQHWHLFLVAILSFLIARLIQFPKSEVLGFP